MRPGPACAGAPRRTAAVRLYANGTCVGPPARVGAAAALASPGLRVAVEHDATTRITARAVDGAGNASPCSEPLTYVHETGNRCRGRAATIAGTPGRDRLAGTPGRDVIAALGGDDRVRGLRGSDLVCGGGGDDTVKGGGGGDELRGGRGEDRLVGGRGRDELVGGPGRDRRRQ